MSEGTLALLVVIGAFIVLGLALLASLGPVLLTVARGWPL